MAQPQPGIVPEPGPNALFLVLRVRDTAERGPEVARLVARTPALAARVAALDRKAKLACTVALGPEFWDVVSPGRRPAGLRPFRAVTAGDGRLRPPGATS